MAGDFVKVRSDLSKHPLVVRMANYLLFCDESLFEYSFSKLGQDANVGSASCLIRHAVAGAVVAVAAYFEEYGDREGDDWIIDSLENCSDLDDVTGIAGIGEAMADVGWVCNHTVGLKLSSEAWGS